MIKKEKNSVLRVGTTGDYAPMTYLNSKTQEYMGFDIEMAKALSKYLGLKVQFVKTTWQTLSQDLKDNKFDIAMGGICGTKERANDFLFSDSVMKTGKVPLIRIENIKKYTSMKNIDRPDVTIVANNGGTNMLFSLANIKKAIITIVPENKMNFEYLLDGKADVFFTDRIEALYKEKANPELVAVNPNHPQDSADMVYLIPKTNNKLQEKVDTWLKLVKKNGSYNQFLEKALNTKY